MNNVALAAKKKKKGGKREENKEEKNAGGGFLREHNKVKRKIVKPLLSPCKGKKKREKKTQTERE